MRFCYDLFAKKLSKDVCLLSLASQLAHRFDFSFVTGTSICASRLEPYTDVTSH